MRNINNTLIEYKNLIDGEIYVVEFDFTDGRNFSYQREIHYGTGLPLDKILILRVK